MFIIVQVFKGRSGRTSAAIAAAVMMVVDITAHVHTQASK